MAEEYTGDEGNEALAAGVDIMDGTEDWRDGWRSINKSRDITVEQVEAERLARIAADNTKADKPSGGAGVARREPGSVHSIGFYTNSAAALFFRPEPTTATFDRMVITASELAQAIADIPPPDLSSRVAKSGDTMTGNLFLPNSTAATSGYTVAYIDGTGRVSRGASTERVKKYISPIAPSVLGDVFPELFRFQMRTGDGSWKFGYIAERLAESDALRPFVVWETEDDGKTLALDNDGNPIPLSIDFISLLIVQVAQLNAARLDIERRLGEIERKLTSREG